MCLNRLFLAALLLAAGLVSAVADSPSSSPPTAPEVAARLRTEIRELAEPAVGETNVGNYLRSLAPRVLWGMTNAPASRSVLARTNIYSGGAGYLRIAEVGPGLPQAFASALAGLRATPDLAGIVLDLRFANGSDFDAAAATAAVLAERTLQPLRLGDRSLAVERAEKPPGLPVMILIHRQTSGAAEALAAAVRAAVPASLLIGTNTAGQARLYRPLRLADGFDVEVATTPLLLSDGRPFPWEGLAPDLAVSTPPPEDEERYLTNEFARVAVAQHARATAAFRLNEAELVRQMRGGKGRNGRLTSHGAGSDTDGAPGAPETNRRVAENSNPPTVQDPLLARAIDLISGLAARNAPPESPKPAGDSR